MLYNVGLVSAVQQSKSAIPIHGAAAKLLQSCLALCDPIDGSPPGSPVPGILQARTLEWVCDYYVKTNCRKSPVPWEEVLSEYAAKKTRKKRFSKVVS